MKVLIGTPSHSWNLHVKYVDSLIRTLDLCKKIGIDVYHCFLCGESLVQLARNELFKLAYDQQIDFLFFIDDDMVWIPEDFVKLLNSGHPFIAAAGRKKIEEEEYAVNVGFDKEFRGTETQVSVKGVGAAFMCLSKETIQKLYEDAPFYKGPKGIGKMVFDIGIVDGELYSEDHLFCKKWRDMGGEVFIDTTVTLGHIGEKQYTGNLQNFIQQKVIELNKDILEKEKTSGCSGSSS
jgi:glycosyltransferase involved in cell wall biosynthesis